MTAQPGAANFLRFNPDEARKLLAHLDQIHLVAIMPDAPQVERPRGKYFGSDVEAALAWAQAVNGNRWGVYWTLNYVGPNVGTKPGKADVQAARGAHADLDPPKDGSGWDKRAMAATLAQAASPPSLIIDSGNGLQPVWLLDEPARDWAVIEATNGAIRDAFGGDDCHNIDRLLRLPGSVNFPTKAKRARGYVPCMAGLAQDDTGQRYRPAELAAAFPAVPRKSTIEASSGNHGVRGTTGLLIEAIRRGDAWHTNLLKLTARLTAQGRTTDEMLAMAEGLTLADYTVEETRADMRGMIADARRKWSHNEPADGGGAEPFDPETGKIIAAAGDVSEDAIAQAFTARFKDSLRFDHTARAWYEWSGTRWKRDGRDRAFSYCREIGRSLSRGDKGERSLRKAAVAAGAERFARADPAHAVDASVWDTDLMLLGTPGGTIDLKTGELRNAVPGDMITKEAEIVPETGAPALWLRFLNEATGGDPEMIRFLQQWCGYSLTGMTTEHALLFVYGPGGNGKSVFLNTIAAILGDYAETATMETFVSSKFDRHSTELAMLAGARMVTASETEEGRAWAEARVKQMTGGDPITARFMHRDNFTFRPQFKLLIAGNHAPALRNIDEAMRRRFNIAPFVLKPETPDRQLEEKLKAEYGQILSWAVAGCLDWQQNGLLRPASVTEATADYFSDQDLLGQWIAEYCDTGPTKVGSATALYGGWCEYARAAGEEAGSQKSFASTIGKRGFLKKRTAMGMVYQRLALRSGPISAGCVG